MRYRKWLSVLLATIMIGGLAACGSSGKSAALQEGKFTLEDTTLDFGSNQVTADKVDMKTVTVKDDEKPEGLVSDLYEVTIVLELEEPVTLSLPLDEATKPDDPDAAAMRRVDPVEHCRGLRQVRGPGTGALLADCRWLGQRTGIPTAAVS